jgi:hypothetical protein
MGWRLSCGQLPLCCPGAALIAPYGKPTHVSRVPWQPASTFPYLTSLVSLSHTKVAVQELREENERLRRDNERFVRLIDSGEWGRGRVAELVSAGERQEQSP